MPMQFTGLLDKHGKEIYEGDIVRKFSFKKPKNDHSDGQPSRVHWQPSSCGFNLRRPFLQRDGRPSWEYEVIGNIHQNPELLKP